jgi:VanZ family protein
MPLHLNTNQWKWLAFGWFFLSTTLLLLPGSALPQSHFFELPHFDKFIHVLLFAGIAFLCMRAFSFRGPLAIASAILLIILYGIGIEYIQLYFIPFRSFDNKDIAADALGAVLGWFMHFTIPNSSIRGNAH